MSVCYLIWFLPFLFVGQLQALESSSDSILSTSYEDDQLITSTHDGGLLENDSYSSDEDFSHLSNEFLLCLKILVSRELFQVLENGSLYIPIYRNITKNYGLWNSSDFMVYQNNAYICPLPLFHRKDSEIEEHDRPSLFQSALPYITIIGIGISLLCLLLHFIAFLIVPEMRNLPGKNIASLTFSIFCAYLFFLIGRIGFLYTPVCSILGPISYYFFLASFFWMNTVTFDIFRSFRGVTKNLRLPSKSVEIKRFIYYSLYSWLFPAIFLGVVIAADKTNLFPKEFRSSIIKENSDCWLHGKLAVMLYFATPYITLLIANIGFFISSAKIIFSNSMKSKDHAITLKRKFILYLKLAVITGLVWITGIIATFTDLEPISYIFVILSTLQGLFIFICFTRFRKTIFYLAKRFDCIGKIVASSSILGPEVSRKASSTTATSFKINLNDESYKMKSVLQNAK